MSLGSGEGDDIYWAAVHVLHTAGGASHTPHSLTPGNNPEMQGIWPFYPLDR